MNITKMSDDQLKREIKVSKSITGDMSDTLKEIQGSLNSIEIDAKKESPMKAKLILQIKKKNLTQEFTRTEKEFKKMVDEMDAMEKELATR